MIILTRLNGSQFALNADLLERIHENPDTTLVTVDGATFIVQESMVEVIELITRYRSGVVAYAARLAADLSTNTTSSTAGPAEQRQS